MNTAQWTTEFDHHNHTMTHTFSDQIQVVTDFRRQTVNLFREGRKIDHQPLDEFNVTDYADYLVRIEKEAKSLKQLTEVQG